MFVKSVPKSARQTNMDDLSCYKPEWFEVVLREDNSVCFSDMYFKEERELAEVHTSPQRHKGCGLLNIKFLL